MPDADEPVHEAGDPAPRQQHAVREHAHPEAATRGVGELEQRVVLGEREAVGRLQLLVEPAREHGACACRNARHEPRRGSSRRRARSRGVRVRSVDIGRNPTPADGR